MRVKRGEVLRKLRKRKIANLNGVSYKRQPNKNGDFHYFSKNSGGFGFYFCNDLTFLNVVKNKDRWEDLDFKHRI